MEDKKKLLIALVLGIVAVFVTRAYINSRVSEYKPKDYLTIVLAKKAIKAGSTLRKKSVVGKKVPKNFAPKSKILWKDIDQYLGQQLAVDVISKDYVLENQFTIRRSLTNKLSGMVKGEGAVRAVNLPVDDTNSLAGSIVPGDRIDIIYAFTIPGVPAKLSTMLLQNVEVITTGTYFAAAQEIGSRGGRQTRYGSLTLLLSVADAARLIYARTAGQVHILLRNEADNDLVDLAPIAGVADVLAPADKARMDQVIKSIARPDFSDDKMKAQLKEIFEARRKQAGRGK